MTREFQVQWTIDVDADSHEGAAREALAMQRDASSIATVFRVTDGTYSTEVDVTPPAPLDDPRYPSATDCVTIAAAFWDRFQDNDPPVSWEALSPEGKSNRVLELAQYADILASLGFEVVRVGK